MNEAHSPNFLHRPSGPVTSAVYPSPETPPEPTRSRAWIRRLTWYAAIALIATIVLLTAPLVYGMARASSGALTIRSAVREAQVAAQAREFDQVLLAVDQAQIGLTEIRAGLRATGNWRVAPWIGSRLRALEEVERAGETALAGFRDLVAAAVAIQEAFAVEGVSDPLNTVTPGRSFDDLTADEKRHILARIDASLGNIRRARERIAIASEAWERIPKDDLLGPARNALEPLAARLPELARELDRGVSLAEILLPLVGYPSERTYLVLLQNADELRPTGGFIGNVGEVTVDAADFKKIDFKDVYAVDDPVARTWRERPPEIMQRELGIPAWFLRDANWSPDVPESALRVMDFYERETKLGTGRDVRLDSVVMIQPAFFRELLKLTGPLTVEGKTFTADNFFDQLQYDVEIGFHIAGIPLRQRKEVVAKVGDVLLTTLMSQPASRWSDLVRIANEALGKKDIIIYSRDPNLQSLLDARDWSGRAKGASGDYLWVIDTNLAALKTDGVMDKEIHYSVDATDPAGPIATVRLRYTNTNRAITWRYTRYRSYTRVYVPEGSVLLSSSATRPDVFRELGKTVFGAFWVVEPGRTGELTFRYRLPSSVPALLMTGTYPLTVQKQPGSKARLTLDLSFGKKLKSAEPPEESEQFGDTHFRWDDRPLDRDTLFQITF